MTDTVMVPLPGIGTLELPRDVYERALRPIAHIPANSAIVPPESLVTAKALALTLSLPVSCLYEYAKAGRIPSVRVGKHVRFNSDQVLAALRATGAVTVGRS